MSTHSPGPWQARHLEHFDGGDGVEIVDANGETVVDSQPYYPHALDLQNANLIAAAPELLSALQVLVENGGIGPEQMFRDARAAISKARGIS